MGRESPGGVSGFVFGKSIQRQCSWSSLYFVTALYERLSFLTSIDWSEETFITFLAERNPDIKTVITKAGPLYKMMLHYGSYPFSVDLGKRMTCGTFLRGIYMMSRCPSSVLWRDYGLIGGVPRTRQRGPVDDVRLLFRSMAGRIGGIDSQRTEEDDEDLLDVLFFVMHRVQEERSLKYSSRRETVKMAASALPSSYSRNLRGKVEPEDLRNMFKLVVALLNCRLLGMTTPPGQSVIDRMMSAFSPASSEHLGTE